MNKAFKVLWNEARRTFIVSSETKMTCGKPSKCSKTVVAVMASIVALWGGCSIADELNITNSYLQEKGTTKFHSGHGQTVNIQTEGDARNLLKALLGKGNVFGALGHDGKNATIVGLAGGSNALDPVTYKALSQVLGPNPTGLGKLVKSKLEDKFGKEKVTHLQTLWNQFQNIENGSGPAQSDTNIIIGGTTKNPLVVATVGGDRVINLGMNIPFLSSGQSKVSLTRVGSSTIKMESGNSLLLTSASSAINIGNVVTLKASGIPVNLKSLETSVILDGDASISLLKSSSSFATVSGGSAVALGGKATSTVTGTTSLLINTQTKPQGFEGITVGALGGGLAIGAMGGSSTSEVQGSTLVDIQSGLNLGIFGGGLAAAGQIPSSLIEGFIPQGYKDNIILNKDAFAQGGTASASSQLIRVNLGKDSSNAFVIGGALAGAFQYDDATAPSEATGKTGDVQIVIGESGSAPVFASVEEKGTYFRGLKENLKKLQAINKNTPASVLESTAQDLVSVLAAEPGVNVGVMGGGMALAWSRNKVYAEHTAITAPVASAETENVRIDVLSGYNVGIFGGGLAAASGDAAGLIADKPSAELAKAAVKSVTMNFSGGETIGVMGGGIAIASGTQDMNFGTSAIANVDTVNLNLLGGSVDGLIGGGYAVDDTNPVLDGQPQATKNAFSKVGTVNINAASGTIGRLAFDVAIKNNQMPPYNKTRPEIRDYLDSMTYAMIQGKTGIIGGGVASGLRNEAETLGGAHVDTVNIVLTGNTIVGEEAEAYRANIYGGGLATEGALSTVGNVNIQIGDGSSQGPVIHGDIYGGGLALDGMYDNAPYYNNAQSKVGKVNIVIAGGAINGDIYAGGRVISSEKDTNANEASSSVESAQITFLSDIGFKGNVDGNNVSGASVLAFGSADAAFNAKFEGGISNFNELKVASGSHVELGNLDVKKSGKDGVLKLTGKGQVLTDNLNIAEGSRLEVLGGMFIASSADLAGGMLYLDPAWNEEPSLAAIENPSEIKSQIVVGQNSALTLGTNDAQHALAALKDGGHSLSENDVKAVAYVAKPIQLSGSAALHIDGAAENNAETITPANGVTVKKDSMLIVHGGSDQSMITGTQDHAFKTEAGSTVMVKDAVSGKHIQLASGFGDMTIDGSTTIKASNRVINLKKISNDEDGELVVAAETKLDSISNVLIPNTVLAVAQGKDGQGADRINSILDTLNGLTDKEAEQALNSIALMGAASGSQTIAINTSDVIQDSLILHGSTLAAYAHENAGPDLWIDANGIFSKANGYKAGSEKFGYKSDLAGLTVGGDYAFGNGAALGLAASFGKGSVRGQGSGSGIKNDIDYYGVNLYGVWNTPYVNIIGTVGYLQSKNEIKQNGYKGKPDAKSVSLGVHAEKPLALNETLTVTPHVGVRYTHVKLDSFNAGGIAYKADKANLVSVPFGVAFNANLTAPCGAKVKPFIDATIAPNFGDRKVKNKVGLEGVGTLDSFDARIANNAMYRGKVGIEASKGNHSFGLNYGIGGGNLGRVDQTLQAKYRYQF